MKHKKSIEITILICVVISIIVLSISYELAYIFGVKALTGLFGGFA